MALRSVAESVADSARDLGDSCLAEEACLEALATKGDFGPALSAQGEIYVARGDYKQEDPWETILVELAGLELRIKQARPRVFDFQVLSLYVCLDGAPGRSPRP